MMKMQMFLIMRRTACVQKHAESCFVTPGVLRASERTLDGKNESEHMVTSAELLRALLADYVKILWLVGSVGDVQTI